MDIKIKVLLDSDQILLLQKSHSIIKIKFKLLSVTVIQLFLFDFFYKVINSILNHHVPRLANLQVFKDKARDRDLLEVEAK